MNAFEIYSQQMQFQTAKSLVILQIQMIFIIMRMPYSSRRKS
jgi:hypothetical protein